MSRLISALSAAEAVCRAFNIPIGDMVDVLGDVPTIEAVPVVRCKDCKYIESAQWNKKGYRICPASHMEITDDDFCSYGEREEATND